VYYDIDEAARVVRVLRVGRKVREQVTLGGIPTDMRDTKDEQRTSNG
jgi:hypothetical protein